MYHVIVRKRILGLFEAINRGDAGPVVGGFTRDFEHIFLGSSHALRGRRTTIASTRQWYERLYRLFPDIHFTVHRMDVVGPPWRTIAVIEWTDTNTATDGVPTTTSGVHVVHLRWGRMRRLLILPDTATLVGTLERTRETSNGESVALPLEDLPGWPDGR